MKDKILSLYNNPEHRRPPSMQWIAEQVGCTKQYVHKVLKRSKK